jgi:ElaB/YqjD/DUF883 family membrane-anchored ribosome-binding protein
MNEETFNRLADDLRHILADLEESLRQGIESAEGQADGRGAELRAALHRARDDLRAAQAALAARGRHVDETVRAHPWKSVAVAGLAGFLLGRLAGRR